MVCSLSAGHVWVTQQGLLNEKGNENLGRREPSAEPPRSPLDTLGLARCAGKESGGGGARREGEKVGWIVVRKDGALWADAKGGCGEAPQRLFGLHSLLRWLWKRNSLTHPPPHLHQSPSFHVPVLPAGSLGAWESIGLILEGWSLGYRAGSREQRRWRRAKRRPLQTPWKCVFDGELQSASWEWKRACTLGGE